jgi:hypothetical protein
VLTTRFATLLGCVVLSAATAVQAQDPPSSSTSRYADLEEDTFVPTREWGTWEVFAIGPYTPSILPDADPPLEQLGGDRGPLLSTELDVYIVRIPYVGHLGVGGRIGWAKYSGPTAVVNGADPGDGDNGDDQVAATEQARLTLFPLSPMAVLRIDVLAREFGVPILFAAKLGLDVIPWRSTKGGATEDKGVELGMRWGAQVALELDFLEPRAARRLDDEWGINHTFIFCELFGSTADAFGTNLAWTAGLGLVF